MAIDLSSNYCGWYSTITWVAERLNEMLMIFSPKLSCLPLVRQREINMRLTYDPVSSLDAHLPHGRSKHCHVTPQLPIRHLRNLLICLRW